MKKILWLMLLCLTVRCGDKKEIEIGIDGVMFFADYSSVPFIDVPIENLPAWLVDWIDEYVALFDGNISGIACVKIFRGELKRQIVYFIYDVNDSCLGCNIYYGEGNKIDSFLLSGLAEESKNWVLIYKIGCELWD